MSNPLIPLPIFRPDGSVWLETALTLERRMRAIILSLPLLIAAGAGNAATYNSAVVRATCGAVPNVETQLLSSESVALGVSAGPPANSEANCSAGANAFAGSGVARVNASIENPGSDDSLALIRGDASAYAEVSYDLIVAAPITETDPFEFSINMDASGSISAFSRRLISDTGAFLNSGQIISAGLVLSGSLRSNRSQNETFEETISLRANPGESESASLSGDFTTPSIMVSPGDLITYTFRLSGGTSGQLYGQSASGDIAADRSLSFATSGPVFNMPDGYTVDIDEARIIDNRYYTPEMALPGETIAPSPVPLPAAGWALLSGMLALLALKRRQKTA